MTKKEALNMAIDTLSEECNVIEKDCDNCRHLGKNGKMTIEQTISRNSIIEVLNKMDRYVANELTLCDTERKFPKNEVFIVDDVYEEIVEQLSSMQPKPRTGRWISDVLDKIRAEIEHLTYYWCEVNPRTVIDDVLKIIDKYKAERNE